MQIELRGQIQMTRLVANRPLTNNEYYIRKLLLGPNVLFTINIQSINTTATPILTAFHFNNYNSFTFGGHNYTLFWVNWYFNFFRKWIHEFSPFLIKIFQSKSSLNYSNILTNKIIKYLHQQQQYRWNTNYILT